MLSFRERRRSGWTQGGWRSRTFSTGPGLPEKRSVGTLTSGLEDLLREKKVPAKRVVEQKDTKGSAAARGIFSQKKLHLYWREKRPMKNSESVISPRKKTGRLRGSPCQGEAGQEKLLSTQGRRGRKKIKQLIRRGHNLPWGGTQPKRRKKKPYQAKAGPCMGRNPLSGMRVLCNRPKGLPLREGDSLMREKPGFLQNFNVSKEGGKKLAFIVKNREAEAYSDSREAG